MAPGASAGGAGELSLSLLPLKPGDHLWRAAPEGSGTWHALYIGQFILVPSEDGAKLALASGKGAEALPQSVLIVMPAGLPGAGTIARLPLVEFAGRGPSGASDGANVRLFTHRPRGRREAVSRALRVCGTRVDLTTITSFPELLPWWSIFDDQEVLQPGLCATRAKAVRYRLSPKGDEPVSAALMNAVLTGGAVVRKGRVVLKGVRLMKVLRLTKAAGVGWANLGGFVGQAIAASILDDGDTGTALATTAGGWAGGIAGGGAAAMVGVESLGAGSIFGGLVVCSSMSAVGAVAGAGLAYAAKKAIDRQTACAEVVRSAEYYDCGLRLIGDADDVFNLFDATLEFPPEDAGFLDDAPAARSAVAAAAAAPLAPAAAGRVDVLGGGGGSGDGSPTDDGSTAAAASPSAGERITAAGWYAVRVQPGSGGIVML
mmetsp:Transcript_91681/g.262636  ORF Transcript_91681/g.262636 Transcript_91681/m.262636 type:complete len:431 (-) Transcript_91681:37-1329(-)